MPPSVSMVMSVPLAKTVRLELPDVRLRASEAMSGFIKSWIDDGTVEKLTLQVARELVRNRV